jgi:hypothetical protein
LEAEMHFKKLTGGLYDNDREFCRRNRVSRMFDPAADDILVES